MTYSYGCPYFSFSFSVTTAWEQAGRSRVASCQYRLQKSISSQTGSEIRGGSYRFLRLFLVSFSELVWFRLVRYYFEWGWDKHISLMHQMFSAASQFPEAPGLAFLGVREDPGKGWGEEIGNYNGKSKCSTALEFGRKRNMALELIIRMVVISLRDWGGTMPHSIQCMDQSGYLRNACWLSISTTMCTFGESSDLYSGFCVEWPDGIIREANADWWVNYGEMISVK